MADISALFHMSREECEALRLLPERCRLLEEDLSGLRRQVWQSEAESAALREVLRALFAVLPPEQRQALLLRLQERPLEPPVWTLPESGQTDAAAYAGRQSEVFLEWIAALQPPVSD